MKTSVVHPVYGEIVYEESAWTGKQSLTVNGAPLAKLGKKSYALCCGEEKITATIKGSYLFGAKLIVKGEEIRITPSAKWYEIASSLFIFVLIMAWGTSPELCQIVPIVGGAIGGAISGAMAVFNMLIMKSVKNPWLKLVSWIGMTAAAFVLCFAVAVAIISALV